MEGRRAGDPANLIGECARAHTVLGWKPEHAELRTIIRTVWNWMGA
jgi:UDP-glucose 4-epimerase